MPSSINFTEIGIKEGIPYASYGGACVIELRLIEKEAIINLLMKMKTRKELLMSDMLIKNGELIKHLNRVLNTHIEEVHELKNTVRNLEEELEKFNDTDLYCE